MKDYQKDSVYDPTLMPCPVCGSRGVHVYVTTLYGTTEEYIECENPGCEYTVKGGANYPQMQTEWNNTNRQFVSPYTQKTFNSSY